MPQVCLMLFKTIFEWISAQSFFILGLTQAVLAMAQKMWSS